MKSGTQQNLGVGTNSGNIGNYPNLAQALKYADITAPTTPGAFNVTLNSSKQPVLSWTKSTDNFKLRNYRIVRNNISYKTVTSLGFTDTGVVSGGTYTYKIRATDYSGNLSPYTTSVTVKIP